MAFKPDQPMPGDPVAARVRGIRQQIAGAKPGGGLPGLGPVTHPTGYGPGMGPNVDGGFGAGSFRPGGPGGEHTRPRQLGGGSDGDQDRSFRSLSPQQQAADNAQREARIAADAGMRRGGAGGRSTNGLPDDQGGKDSAGGGPISQEPMQRPIGGITGTPSGPGSISGGMPGGGINSAGGPGGPPAQLLGPMPGTNGVTESGRPALAPNYMAAMGAAGAPSMGGGLPGLGPVTHPTGYGPGMGPNVDGGFGAGSFRPGAPQAQPPIYQSIRPMTPPGGFPPGQMGGGLGGMLAGAGGGPQPIGQVPKAPSPMPFHPLMGVQSGGAPTTGG